MRIVDGCIAGEWLKPRTIVPVDLGETSQSSSNAEELMVISDVDVAPVAAFIGTANIGIESVVTSIVFIHIGILTLYHKCHVKMVVSETKMRDNIA